MAYLKLDDVAVSRVGFVFGLMLFLPVALDFACLVAVRLLVSFL